MNIFIIILVVLFMGAYYMMDAPNIRNTIQETEQAIKNSDLRSITECASAVHNGQIKGYLFDDICVKQNGIESKIICLNKFMNVTECNDINSKKSVYHYIVTATMPIPETEYNNMMEILEKYYSDSGTFGIFIDNFIMSGATSIKHIIPKGIISDMNLQPGQIVYMTQFETLAQDIEFATPDADGVVCPAWTTKTYRFGRWQCIGYNTKTNCPGDTVWDSDSQTCIPDESRKPLCSNEQTAVIVDGVWECVNPFPERKCSGNMVARLNYSTLEWECVSDPNIFQEHKKCKNIVNQAVRGAIGATLRIPQNSCTDCEKMLLNEDTCTSVCVPDTDKINNKSCYPDDELKCRGENYGMYFGFPNLNYAKNVESVSEYSIPIDENHSQNRKFNCMECPYGIDTDKSKPPYIIICRHRDDL